MKVLFISRAKPVFGIGRFVKHQGESLIRQGVDVEFFPLKGKGLIGYIRSYLKLRNHIKNYCYDIVHSHYIYSSFVAYAAMRKKNKLVVSLLGSDLKKNKLFLILIRYFVSNFAGAVIVKNSEMQKILNLKDSLIIPNGVNIDRFESYNKEMAKNKVGFDDCYHVLFFSNPPDRIEKNLKLANEVFSGLDSKKFQLHVLSKTPNEEVPFFMNAADTLLMTSLHEGSPNVVKEAMACNLPVVSVDVGDVRTRLSEVRNCHITSYDPSEIRRKLIEVCKKQERSNGREVLIGQGLDEVSVAKKIIRCYNKILTHNETI